MASVAESWQDPLAERAIAVLYAMPNGAEAGVYYALAL